MTGLMVKDLKLMLQRKRFLIVLIAMGLLMLQQGGMAAVAYLTMIAVVFSLSTVSYDEYENGFTFLMTLPFDRRTYVREKYLLSILSGAAGCLVGCVMYAVSLAVKGEGMRLEESLVQAAVCLSMSMLMAAVMLPLHLKFGAEQGRILLFVVAGAFVLAGSVCMELIKGYISPERLFAVISGMGVWGLAGCLAALSLLLTLLSCCISIHVMERKEF